MNTEKDSDTIEIYNTSNGSKEIIKRPPSIKALKKEICKIFKVSEKQIHTITDVEDNDLTDKKLRSSNQVLFTLKNQKKTEFVVNEEVEIIPDVAIMIHGGDEYDFITALAEIIDNSIQNTVNQKNRRIEITLKKGEKPQLIIWDNGRGMNKEGLTSWATLGRTSPPEVFMTASKIEKYLTSDFSRYGVGSKKAIFNLGSEVTLISKVKSSRWVYEVSLSRARLEQEEDKLKQWRTTTISRAPTEEESKYESFTKVIISQLKELYVHKYNPEDVRRKLAHLYHYYIFGPNGNSKEISESEEEEDVDDEFEEDPKEFTNYIDIIVDGVSLRKVDDDLETKYLRLGKNPWTFEFKVTATEKAKEDFSSSQDSLSQGKNIVSSIVKCVLYYYPFKNGETLPIPFDIDPEVDNPDNIPLSERLPGFECFWNGRLLSKERIQSLQFMKEEKRSTDIPSNCYRRVKGMMFLDSSFPVSANKLYLLQQTPIFQALMQYNDRKLSSQFKKWIKECHQKFDEEIIFEELDNQKELKGDRLYYKKVTFGSKQYTKGSKVSVRTRPKLIGEIIEMFRDASAEHYTCYCTVREWNNDRESTFLINKIQILTPSEYKHEVAQLKSKQPAYIAIVDTPKVKGKDIRPPSEPVEAGYIIKYITVSMFSADHKPITKKNVSIKLICTHKETDTSWSLIADRPYQKNLYCFKPASMKPPDFQLAGTYEFRFQADTPGITSKNYILKVLPSKPVELQCSNELPLNVCIGDKFPEIVIQQVDKFGNVVPFPTDISNKSIKIKCLENKMILSQEFTCKLDKEKNLIIDELRLESGSISDGSKKEKTKLEITYGDITPLSIPVTISPGIIPHALIFSEETKKLLEEVTTVGRTLPPIKLHVLDQWKNQIIQSPGEGELVCTAECELFEESYEAALRDGLFSFADDNILKLKKDIVEECQTKIHFMIEDTECHLEWIVNVKPSVIHPKFIRLIPPDSQKSFLRSNQSNEAEIHVVFGTDLEGWQLELLDDSKRMEYLNASVSVGWGSNRQFDMDKGICTLPKLNTQKQIGNLTYSIKIYPHHEDEESDPIEFILKVVTIKGIKYSKAFIKLGPPCIFANTRANLKSVTCGKSFEITFAIKDAHDNILNPDNEEDTILYPDLKKITPQIEFLPKDKENGEIEHIKKDTFKLSKTSRGTFKYSDIVLLGPVGMFQVCVKDVNQIVKDLIIELEMRPGDVKYLKVNGLKEQTYEVFNHTKLPQLHVTAHDEYGTKLYADDRDQIKKLELEVKPIGDLELRMDGAGNENSSQQASLETIDGEVVLPPLYPVCTSQGTYAFAVAVKGNENISPAMVHLKVSSSKHPIKFKFLNTFKKVYTAGEKFGPCEVQVIQDDGNVTRGPEAIRVRVKSPDSDLVTDHISQIPSFSQENTPSENVIHKFPNTEMILKKVGDYEFDFKMDLSSLETSKWMSKPFLTKTKRFKVIPGKPKSLIAQDEDYQLSAVSNIPTETSQRTFWDNMIVHVVDEFGNEIEDYDKDFVEIKLEAVEASSNKKDWPQLDGTLKAKIENGKAKFGRLSVKEGTGKQGLYKLCFCAPNLKMREYEFTFSDDAQLQVEQNRLFQQQKKIEKQIEKKESQILKAEKEHEKNEKELEALKKQRDEMIKELEKLEIRNTPNYKECTSSDIKKLSEKLNSILIKKKESKKSIRRIAKYPKDKYVEQMMDALGKEGEASGIIGPLGDLGFVEDERLSRCIANLIGVRNMKLMVVKDGTTAEKWRTIFKDVKDSISLLPFDNVTKFPNGLDANGKLKFPDLGSPFGFIGYAANLIDLRPNQFYLRHAFHALLGGTLIFETYQTAMAFRKSRIETGKQCPLIMTLDGERLEHTGIIYAGEKRMFDIYFGQLPISESREFKRIIYKKEKLDEFAKFLERMEIFERSDYAETLKELKNAKSKHEQSISKLKQELNEIKKKLKKLKSGITKKEIKLEQDSDEEEEEEEVEEVEEKVEEIEEEEAEEVEEEVEEIEEEAVEETDSEYVEERPAKKRKLSLQELSNPKKRKLRELSPELFSEDEESPPPKKKRKTRQKRRR